jgi:hypothetical protein
MKIKNQTPLVTVTPRFSLRKHAFCGILALVSLLTLGITQSARASYMVTLQEVGSNVVANGSGAFNLTALTFQGQGSGPQSIWGSVGEVIMGVGNVDLYGGLTGPASFGSGLAHGASFGSGDATGINGTLTRIYVPHLYVSGALSDSMTFNGATFATLGVTPGTYTWTWGTGMNADSYTLQIGPAGAVPDAGSTLSLLGFASLGLVALRRKLRC